MRSLQSRLHFGLGVTLLIMMLLLWWLISATLARVAEDLVQSRLEHDADVLFAALQVDDTGRVSLKESRLGQIYQRVFSGHYYSLIVDDQVIRSRSLWDKKLVPNKTMDVGYADGPKQQPLLLWQKRFYRFDKNIMIMVAEDLTPLRDALQKFNAYFAMGCLVIIMILLLVQRFVVLKSLVSLKKVQQELQQLAEGEVETLSEQVPTEILPLVDEVNHLLQLLGQRLQRSRNALGNLAHSLKHPLNLLMQLAEQEALNIQPEISSELRSNTQQIFQLMERELRRARLAGAGLPGQRFNANDELPALIDVLRRVYHDKSLDIQATVVGNQENTVDRNDMLELLGNLLDNACKWARHQVRCEVDTRQGLRVTIEDDGPGCDEQQMENLTQRGVRVDESISGSGLGLAIVKDIVQLYQGELHFDRSPELGGLRIVVELTVH